MTRKSRKLYVNLPVADLPRSVAFFERLGFDFDRQLTDASGACMVISPVCSVMLLTESFFRTFTKKELCDTSRRTEGMIAVSCDSDAEVDRMVRTALACGGKPAMNPVRHGTFMYGWSFYDLDDHHWEVLHTNPAALHS